MDTPIGAILRWGVTMTKRKRREFTDEFKADAVKLVREGGRSIGQVAKDLDLTETVLRNWVRRAEIEVGNGPPGALTQAEREELVRLRRENKRLQMEREILKKAAAFFAKESE
jgi:transposase-like protein